MSASRRVAAFPERFSAEFAARTSFSSPVFRAASTTETIHHGPYRPRATAVLLLLSFVGGGRAGRILRTYAEQPLFGAHRSFTTGAARDVEVTFVAAAVSTARKLLFFTTQNGLLTGRFFYTSPVRLRLDSVPSLPSTLTTHSSLPPLPPGATGGVSFSTPITRRY